jgi:hypothetical protein
LEAALQRVQQAIAPRFAALKSRNTNP